MFNKINHVIEGKKKLLYQFKNKKIINILFESIFNQINEIEDTLYDLYYKRNLKDSVGKQIDTNGILRDLERNGLNNTPYEICLCCDTNTTGADIYASLDWEEISR